MLSVLAALGPWLPRLGVCVLRTVALRLRARIVVAVVMVVVVARVLLRMLWCRAGRAELGQWGGERARQRLLRLLCLQRATTQPQWCMLQLPSVLATLVYMNNCTVYTCVCLRVRFIWYTA